MSIYGITAVNWDASHKFIGKLLSHQVVKVDDYQFKLNVGVSMSRQQVVTLIDQGDQVYVMLADEPGSYSVGDTIRIKPGQAEHLESVDKAGKPTNSLYALALLHNE